MELREAYHRGEAEDFEVQVEPLKRELSYHLRDRPMADADNYRLQNELGWYDDRGNLLRFLDDTSVAPTNNRAERALGQAVIALLEDSAGHPYVLGVHQRNQDVGAKWRRPIRVVDQFCALFSSAPLHSPSL